jgi:hypothetical protein
MFFVVILKIYEKNEFFHSLVYIAYYFTNLSPLSTQHA